LEYASEVWDNCGQINSDRLEKVQLEAARIVTGLPSFASINSIEADSINLSMCLVHLQSLLNTIPKCLCVCTGSIVIWSKSNVKLHSTPLTLKIIISVLVGLNFNTVLTEIT
jgi:hypothetical protein